jgi:small acid-soluble spore protein P (minor)
MSKPKTQPAGLSYQQDTRNAKKDNNNANEPLSGSKTVKNRNHSRQNHGEGS